MCRTRRHFVGPANGRDRQELYKSGGLVSVTSRILVVDMLQSDIPTHLITGIFVLHAERSALVRSSNGAYKYIPE
jgi:hypothetical protein